MSLQHPDVALVMVTGVDDPKVGELALNIIKQGRGTHFDAEVVDCYFDSLYEVFQVMATYRDCSPPLSTTS